MIPFRSFMMVVMFQQREELALIQGLDYGPLSMYAFSMKADQIPKTGLLLVFFFVEKSTFLGFLIK